MADTKGDVDLLELHVKEATGDLRGQIKHLQEGMQGSPVHAMSHKEFMAFQDKVMSVCSLGWSQG